MIKGGRALNDAIITERNNQANYSDGLAAWAYQYVLEGQRPLLSLIQASYETGEMEVKVISPQETGVVALASRYLMSNTPRNQDELEKLATFQFSLQAYLGITDSSAVTEFYEDLVQSVRPEHNKLIPVLHFYHTQIHALKMAYDRLKGIMHNADITTRVIFGLVCIEFMKLHVRLYLVEPLARTQEGASLDWIYMLDKVFEDYSMDITYDRVIIGKEEVVIPDYTSESSLKGAMIHIREIRDYVAHLKRIKQDGGDEESYQIQPPIGMDLAHGVINSIKQRLRNGGL